MYDDDRIRQKAYELWLSEGCPEGRDQQHWDAAKEIVAIEGGIGTTTVPVKKSKRKAVEPETAATSLGDVPGLRDQGDGSPVPDVAVATEHAGDLPLSVETPKRARKPKASAEAVAPPAPAPKAAKPRSSKAAETPSSRKIKT